MILIISAVFPPEPVAAARISHDLAVALSEKNEVTVLSPRPTRPCGFPFADQSSHNEGFEHIVLNSFTCPGSNIPGRFIESYSFGKHVVKYIRKNHGNIECLYLAPWPLIAQYMIIKAAVKYKIPSVIHVQDVYPESLSNKMRFFGKLVNFFLLPLDKYSLRCASQIVTISDKMKTMLQISRKISGHKIKVVKNWQDEGTFIRELDLPVKQSIDPSFYRPFTFMYLGNIGPVAGVEFLIRSFIQTNLNGARLIIAGSGSQKQKCMDIKEECEQANVIFMDVPSGKVAEIQGMADVFLLPIKKGASMSSIPSKLPAYMFSRKPILASVDYESDIATAIHESTCGWVVPPEDSGSLIQAMHNAISFPKETLVQFGENGFVYALKNYSKHANLNLLVSIIVQTMNS
jgi:glycosyltransferase involved in cell wall biosynthesis